MLISLLLSLTAFASTDDLTWIRQKTHITDKRFVPYSCSAEGGTYEFDKPSANTKFFCLATLAEDGKRTFLIYKGKNADSMKIFEWKNCKITASYGEQDYGQVDNECAIYSVESDSLKADSYDVKFYLSQRWEYSAGFLQFHFKLQGEKYEGMPVSIPELRNPNM